MAFSGGCFRQCHGVGPPGSIELQEELNGPKPACTTPAKLRKQVHKREYGTKRKILRKYNYTHGYLPKYVPYQPTVLQGDIMADMVPPYLAIVLSYGGKLIPFTSSIKTIQLSNKQIAFESQRLETMLLWSLFHPTPPQPNFFDIFPHRAFLKGCGVSPPQKVLDKLGADGRLFQKRVEEIKDMCRLALQDYPTQELPPRGVVWTPTKLTRFLDTHCVVACNKDGDHNMMSAACYRCEQRAHMHGQHTSGQDG